MREIGTSGRDVETSLKFLKLVLGDYHPRNFEVELWDGTRWPVEPGQPLEFRLILTHPGALRNLLWPSKELTMGEAYIYGDIDIEGNIEAVFTVADYLKKEKVNLLRKMKIGSRLFNLPSRDHPSKVDRAAKLKGKVHSIERDKMAIQYHYDVSNDFFSLWLDKNMVYSCAYFEDASFDIEKAQHDKLEYVARKLYLSPGERMLDIGCGWGSFAIHVAQKYGVEAFGITLSKKQVEFAVRRVEELGLSNRCKVELRDYRELNQAESFDKTVSIGMFEHVGVEMLKEYFRKAYMLLKPGGLFLNHGIAKRATDPPSKEATFSKRYVFPDGELIPLSTTLRVAEEVGFEVRDVESLREHYVMTLRHWVKRLEARHLEAVRASDEITNRIWRLFMSGSAHGFKTGRLNVYQVLLLRPDEKGQSNLPLTRADWYIPHRPRRENQVERSLPE